MPKKLYTATFTFDGKRHYVRSSKSQREADKKAAAKLAELEAGRVILSPSTLVSDYAYEWLTTYQEPAVSAAVYRAQKSLVDRLIVPVVGRLRLRDVRPIQLQKIINAQPDKSKNYYVKLRNLIKAIFAQAVRDKLLTDNPAETLELPAAQDGTHRSLTDAERRAVLYAADWCSFGLFVQTCLWCGLRPQEAAALRYEDIDQINRRMHIRRALKADGTVGETKSRAGVRVVPIPSQLWVRLRPRLREGYIMCDTRGQRMTKTSIRNAWRVFVQMVDIALGAEIGRNQRHVTVVESVIAPDLSLYCMRHTYCTDLQAAGVPINVARDLMGHSDISLTAKIYTHMRDDIMEDAAAKIEAFGATSSATPICRVMTRNDTKDKTSGTRQQKAKRA
ncbi:MAG: site-specific integrase [Butyricicoccus pullicaecorum]|nr:site-specific integrase [Butyricicoccus pullicaecorum]